MWWLAVLVGLFIQRCAPETFVSEPEEVFLYVAGIFELHAVNQSRAFDESMGEAILDQLHLKADVLVPLKTDSYSVWRHFCAQNTTPIVIFGPQNPISDGAIRDQCAIANIPHLQATWQPVDPDDEVPLEAEDTQTPEDELKFKKISINFYPDADEVSMAYAEVLKYYGWKSFSVLYEDDFGLSRVQKILAEYTEKYPVTVRRLDPIADNFNVFKELRKSQESRILLDCGVDNVMKYLGEADHQGLMNDYQHIILYTMDASILTSELNKLLPNITWLSITDNDKLGNEQHPLAKRVGKWVNEVPLKVGPPVTTLKTESLLMDDIANHVVIALKNISGAEDITPGHPCGGEPWKLGATFQEQILKTESQGVSGKVKFNSLGKRVNYTLFLNEIRRDKNRETIGTWESGLGKPIQEKHSRTEQSSNLPSHKEFTVISRTAKPYFYKRESNATDPENPEAALEEYEGFSVDLVKAIFKILKEEMNLNYTYKFSDKEYKGYGKLDPDKKKWDGLIGDLLDKKADLAVCDLTITEERKSVVDFSVPFMTLGISILYMKEDRKAPGIFSFLYPYSFEMWMYTATAYCVVSIVMFVCSRISPADWENPQPCDKDPEELENIWNFKNCAWLTMGSIMTQGCDILPKAIGSRWVCGMWWFFAMIVCQTYIAQLAASMTSALDTEPITGAESLAKQNKILYGAIRGGSTLGFFKNSKDKMYQRMYENMISNPVVLVGTNEEGEKMVLSGKNKYAFFMESVTIDYKQKRDCRLQKVGGELDSKDYGIAMPANSPFRSDINRAILRLKELTKLDEIKTYWWDKVNGAKVCPTENEAKDVEGDLEMENLEGLFLVLIVGLALCLIVTAAEFMNEVRNIVVREQVTHKEALVQELKASLNFFQLQKPVLRNPSRAPSAAASSASSASEKSEEKQNARLAFAANFLDLEKMPQ